MMAFVQCKAMCIVQVYIPTSQNPTVIISSLDGLFCPLVDKRSNCTGIYIPATSGIAVLGGTAEAAFF